ncbi:MAG: type II toxin-antitoxin system RelE/ParE family toxin, partial [Gammaproteobacteria bacterium]
MRVRWSANAKADLRELKALISRDSAFYARRFVSKIMDSAGKLCDQPQLGRRVPEADRDDIRELLFQNYRIIYRLRHNDVYILTVVHGTRDLASR